MEKLIQGYWDCTCCGKNKILDTVKECPSCGAIRGKTPTEGSKSRFISSDTIREIGFGLGILAVMILFTLLIIYTSMPKTYTVRVNGFSWDYSIHLEEKCTVSDSGWSLPKGAKLTDTRSEIYTYNSVLDHYEISERKISNEVYREPIYRQEPVYRIKYYYDMDKWVDGRVIETKGEGKKPYWGYFTLESNEREKTRVSKYFITVTDVDTDKKLTYSVSQDEWSALKKDKVITIKVSLGNITEIKY